MTYWYRGYIYFVSFAGRLENRDGMRGAECMAKLGESMVGCWCPSTSFMYLVVPLYARVILDNVHLVLECIPFGASLVQDLRIHSGGDLALALNKLKRKAFRGMPTDLEPLVSRELPTLGENTA